MLMAASRVAFETFSMIWTSMKMLASLIEMSSKAPLLRPFLMVEVEEMRLESRRMMKKSMKRRTETSMGTILHSNSRINNRSISK